MRRSPPSVSKLSTLPGQLHNPNGPVTYSGCSSLDASQCGVSILSGRPVQDLSYVSPSRGTSVRVDWFESGSHSFAFDAANVIHPLYYVNVLAHEWGHELWHEEFYTHAAPFTGNRIPFASTGPQYGNLLMAGGGYPATRWIGSLSARERDLLGWITPTLLGPAQSGQTISLGDLYTTGQTVKIPVRGSTQNFVYLSNHQYGSYFEDIRTQPSQPYPYNTVAGGLFAPGIAAMYTTGPPYADILPADNTLEGVTICQNGSTLGQLTGQGCVQAPNPYLTDVFAPTAGRQLTPWTSPNINGCANYSTDPHCNLTSGFSPSWQAIDNVRYAADNRTMQFEYYQDIRTRPYIAIRNDSRMGTETAGRTFETVEVRDGARLTVGDGITLSFTGDLVVAAGATLVLEPGATLRFSDSKRLLVYGRFVGTSATLAAANGGTWGGVYVGPNPANKWETSATASRLALPLDGTFTGVNISGVMQQPLFDDPYPPSGAIEVRNRRVMLNGGSTILGSISANGIFAYGSEAQVTVQGQSQIQGNQGVGIYGAVGAQVYVTEGALVNSNAVGGVFLNGYATRAFVDGGATVNGNQSAGVLAYNQSSVRIRSGEGAIASVSDNHGGPTALTSGSVDGGQCNGYTSRQPNRFANNQNGGFYDARAEAGSTVAARYAYWNGRTALTLIQDKSSTISVFPVAPSATSPDPRCFSISMPAERGVAQGSQNLTSADTDAPDAARGGPTTASVVTLATEAREAAWSGDPDGAFALLTQAATESVTEDDREAVYGAIGALVADADSALSVPALVASLEATVATVGPNRAWAQRSLSVAYAVTDRATESDGVAAALVSAQTGTDHATFAHGLRVRLAVETDSLEMALDRLSALGATVVATDTFAVETYASSLALVAASFPNADLSAVTGGGAGRGVAGRSAGSLTGTEASVLGREAFVDEVSVYPNPTASRGMVRVSVSEPAAGASVSVYDALGRRVAVLHDGPLTAGAHDLAFEAGSLAPGVYVVQVRVSSEAGGTWTDVRRVTVAR